MIGSLRVIIHDSHDDDAICGEMEGRRGVSTISVVLALLCNDLASTKLNASASCSHVELSDISDGSSVTGNLASYT